MKAALVTCGAVSAPHQCACLVREAGQRFLEIVHRFGTCVLKGLSFPAQFVWTHEHAMQMPAMQIAAATLLGRAYVN